MTKAELAMDEDAIAAAVDAACSIDVVAAPLLLSPLV